MGYIGKTHQVICALGGINASTNQDLVRDIDMIPSGTKNLNLTSGGRKKRGGTSKYNSTPYFNTAGYTTTYGTAVVDDDCQSDDTGDWSVALDAVNSTVVFDSDHYELTSDGDANEIFYVGSLTLTKDQLYTLSVDIKDGTESSESINIVSLNSKTVESTRTVATTSSNTTHKLVFKATVSTDGVGIRIPADLAGDNIEIKNVTLYTVTSDVKIMGIKGHKPTNVGNLTNLDDDDQGDSYYDVWCDNDFIYVANGGNGLRVYSVNSSGTLSLIDTDDQGDVATGVWGDGTFIYLANGTGGLHTYSVDGSGTLTPVDDDDQGGTYKSVWGDGDFIYVSNDGLGLMSYSVNGAGVLTYIDADDQGGVPYGLWGDGSFIYVSNDSLGVMSYSVDGSGNLTFVASDNQGDSAYDVWGDDTFIYVANGLGGIHSYSVNSSGSFTHIDNNNQGSNAHGIWGDGDFIYLADFTDGLLTYTVDSNGIFTHIDTDDQGGNYYFVWGDGTLIYTASGSAGLFSYSVIPQNQITIGTTSGELKKIVNSVVDLKTGWTAGQYVSMEVFDGEVYFTNGSDDPEKWDGSSATSSTMTDIPSDWTTGTCPKQFIKHGRGNSERMWAVGCRDTPYTVYASVNGDGDDFSDANVTTINIDTGDGYGIVGAVEFGDRLFCFGKQKSYVIDDLDTNTSNWGYDAAQWDGGVAHCRLITETPNDVICMMDNGEIYSVTAAENYGDYKFASFTRKSFMHEWIKENIDLTAINSFHSHYDKKLRAYRLFVVRNGQTAVDTCLTYYIERGVEDGWMIEDNLNNDSGFDAVCSAEVLESTGTYQFYTGDYNGFLWKLNQSGNTDDSSYYTGQFKTSPTALEGVRTNKHFKRGWLVVEPQGTETINVKVWVDGTRLDTPDGAWAVTTGYTVGKVVTNDGAIYDCTVAHTSKTTDEPGTGVNWEDYWVQNRFSITVASGTNDYAFNINAKGRRRQYEIWNEIVSEDMFINQVLTDYKPLGGEPT